MNASPVLKTAVQPMDARRRRPAHGAPGLQTRGNAGRSRSPGLERFSFVCSGEEGGDSHRWGRVSLARARPVPKPVQISPLSTGAGAAKTARAVFTCYTEMKTALAREVHASQQFDVARIGADGAPDGCVLYNQEAGSGCVGAFSLSPGNYLGMDFAAVVRDLASTPVWCLAGELDSGSAPVCDGASGERYRSVVYPGIDLHGMRLITPDLEPQPLILTQDFLELVFGEIVK